MTAKYRKGFVQRDSVERDEYANATRASPGAGKERDGEANLKEGRRDRENRERDNIKVPTHPRDPDIDGDTVEQALPWLQEHRAELLQSIREGKYNPSPVRRKEIPKPDGGVRKLGIPTVVDRIIQQAIAQQLQPIYEPLFSDVSYGYRPKRSGQQAVRQVKKYAEQGYTYAVEVDLSKYFDTLNHELLMELLRKQIHDKRVTGLIKKYLKAGVMEDGVKTRTRECSPQGGPLSPMLANI